MMQCEWRGDAGSSGLSVKVVCSVGCVLSAV